MTMYHYSGKHEWAVALLPRPSHRPFLVACSMQNGGGRPGPFYHVNDVSVYLGRQRGEGSLIERTYFLHMSLVLNQERYVFRFVNIWNSSTWGRNYKIKPQAYSFTFFWSGTPPPSIYLGRHWRPSCDKMDQAFPLRFCILRAIKNCSQQRQQAEKLGLSSDQ